MIKVVDSKITQTLLPLERVKGLEAEEQKRNPDYKIPDVRPNPDYK